MRKVITRSEEETAALGEVFAASLVPGDVVALSGGLGSGKTSFVKGVCRGLRAGGHVSSPTFTLINEYPAPFGIVAHIDMYRIRSRAELAELGVEEYFSSRFITLVEWAEEIQDILPLPFHRVSIAYGRTDSEREISIGLAETPE